MKSRLLFKNIKNFKNLKYIIFKYFNNKILTKI